MNKYELLEKVNDMRAQNKIRIKLIEYLAEKEAFQANNDILGEVADFLTQESSEDYNRGLNDAWELARKIVDTSDRGGYTIGVLNDIFGTASLDYIASRFTVQEALAKVEEYEKKKAEEAARPVKGDVVKVVSKIDPDDIVYGVYLGFEIECYHVLKKDYCVPTAFPRLYFTLEKTGQHVDLMSWTKGE